MPIAFTVVMINWLIASYIVLVLVFSAKAKALSLESNPALNKFTHPATISSEIEIQDPLPEAMRKTFRQMNIDSVLENFVG